MPSQLRVRRVFRAASKLWSDSEQATEEERDACYAAGAKVQSRSRLNQSGPLTGQQYFAGKMCKGAAGIESNSPCRTKAARFDIQVLGLQQVTRCTWETPARSMRDPCGQHGSGLGHWKKDE
jgi:hypothetical protein